MILKKKMLLKCQLSVQILFEATVQHACVRLSMSFPMVSRIKCMFLLKNLLSPAIRDGWWQQLAESRRVAFDRRGRLMV